MGRCPLQALFGVAAGACWLFLRIPAACRACAARGVLAATVANVVRACRHHVSRVWRLEGCMDNLSVPVLDCPKDVDDDLCAALQSVIRRSPPCYAPPKKNTGSVMNFGMVVGSSRARRSLWFERPGWARRLSHGQLVAVGSLHAGLRVVHLQAGICCLCLLFASCPQAPSGLSALSILKQRSRTNMLGLGCFTKSYHCFSSLG